MASIFDIGYRVPVPPDEPDDLPVSGLQLPLLQGPLKLPPILYGAATFSYHYNTDDVLSSSVPLKTVRLALRSDTNASAHLVLNLVRRYGIRAFDTSVYYGDSEIVLGNILKILEPEFPRRSYQLMTKCGRYGPSTFDYSPKTIRESIVNSLRRLQTDYLDTVYLHDVEHVCTSVSPQGPGNRSAALTTNAAQYGLSEEDKGTIRGEGDQKVLDAILELRRLQEEGIVKHIGITGYPLPTLLRLAILVLHHPPYKPLDVVLSYCHLTLQNSTFIHFAPYFINRARVGQLVAASPLSMGLLTPTVPEWHPAPKELRGAVEEARTQCPMDLANLALGFSIRHTGASHYNIPVVVGLSTRREVHECMKAWMEIQEGGESDEREKWEEWVMKKWEDEGFKDWSWA